MTGSVFFSLDVCVCVCVKVICPCFLPWDAAPLHYQLGKFFLQIEVLKWKLFFLWFCDPVILGHSWGMQNALRVYPETIITVGFSEACFWMNCSLLRATPHKYVWHFIVEEHFNWCFCCWRAKFNTGWLSSKFRWWNDHLVAVEHYSWSLIQHHSTLSGPTGI